MKPRYACFLAFFFIISCQSVPKYAHFDNINISEYDARELLLGEIFASALIQPKSGSHAAGKAWFAKSKDGIQILVVAKHLMPGLHGIHIHEKGDCSSKDALSAGPHYNPSNHKHGAADPHKYHMGDLGNIVISNKGIGILNLGVPAKDHSAHTSWQDIIGRSIVLHASVDDLASQPAGDSGSRIGCGLIEAAR
jgi:superoxide dismutase, Cu-Zn family